MKKRSRLNSDQKLILGTFGWIMGGAVALILQASTLDRPVYLGEVLFIISSGPTTIPFVVAAALYNNIDSPCVLRCERINK